jgi:hypothetical protein
MELDEKVQFIRKALEHMAWHTHPCIASVVGVAEDGGPGLHVGSAFRVSSAGRRCIITAAHVITQARSEYPRFAVTATRGAPPYELCRDPDRVDSVRDLAVYVLPEEYPREGIEFWPCERADTDEVVLSQDFLFVHGFPAKRSHSSALIGGVHGLSLPYGAMRLVENLPSSIEPFQFAMDFDPASFVGPDGSAFEWLDPHGLSGSPVFRIGVSGRSIEEWTPERSLAVGILTQWLPDEKMIVATKWQHILDLLEAT